MKLVVGLGSNLGDRLSYLRAAASRIPEVVARSRIYESSAMGPAQGDFLNAAVLVDCTESAHALLDRLQKIESALGRVRAERWGPRVIDLDILWIEGVTIADARLVVPHPGLLERDFAVRPLLDVLPSAGLVAPPGDARVVSLDW